MFKKVGSANMAEVAAASADIATAVAEPIRQTLLSGDIVMDIYSTQDYSDNKIVEYSTDLITPGDDGEFYAYVVPANGRLPERHVSGDYLRVPTYEVGNAIDLNLRFVRNANWPVINRALEILEAGFVAKMNDDGWQTLIAAGADRNIIINDPNAVAGQFTPRLVSIMQTFMRRNGGGNAATLNRSRLTDIYMSPEAHTDIKAWGLDLVPDQVRTNVYYADPTNQDLINIFGTNIHAYDEFGEGQAYQTYYTSTLGGALAASDLELVVGLDRQRDDSFVHPVVEALSLYEDNTQHRANKFGMYGRTEVGFAVLDNRRILLGSL